MSKPDINPRTTAAGIAVDPRTLERVIPESRRPDGTVRKQLKIRPGFTPQEDVQRFRGTRQAQVDATALPKGHIIGWTPPSSSNTPAKSTAGLSKSAKKNAKRKEKRKDKVEEKVKDNWEDDDDEEAPAADEKHTTTPPLTKQGVTAKQTESGADALAEKLDKLDVR